MASARKTTDVSVFQTDEGGPGASIFWLTDCAAMSVCRLARTSSWKGLRPRCSETARVYRAVAVYQVCLHGL